MVVIAVYKMSVKVIIVDQTQSPSIGIQKKINAVMNNYRWSISVVGIFCYVFDPIGLNEALKSHNQMGALIA